MKFPNLEHGTVGNRAKIQNFMAELNLERRYTYNFNTSTTPLLLQI
jgi:hypothetical protein